MDFFRRVLIFGLIVMALTAWLQRRLMYPATQSPSLAVKSYPKLHEYFHSASDVALKTPDGVTIRGWMLQSGQQRSDHVFLLFHGNAGNRANRGFWYEVIRSLNADVLAIDYHGYGDSGGQPSESALLSDGRAAWDYLTGSGYQPEQILIAGESLGGGVAVQIAAEKCRQKQKPGAVVLIATFDSMLNAAVRSFPWLPVRWVLLDRYHSDRHIPDVACPVLQFHGDQDRIVPLELARNLAAAAPRQSESGRAYHFRVFAGAGHNGMLRDFAIEIRNDIAELLNIPKVNR